MLTAGIMLTTMGTQHEAHTFDLLQALRAHTPRPGHFNVDIGAGWVPLVWEIHHRILEVFPDYEGTTVKEKYGVLEFYARPRPWRDGETTFTRDEAHVVDAITYELSQRSKSICERCGSPGSLREGLTEIIG